MDLAVCGLFFIASLCVVQGQLPFIKDLGITTNFSQGNGSFSAPTGLWLDSLGNLFIADTSNHCVRVVIAESNQIRTFAGTGDGKLGGDGSAASSALLNYPRSVWSSFTGEVFIADTENHRIRIVSSTTNNISTFVGTQQHGVRGYASIGNFATSSELLLSYGLTGDTLGNMYVTENDFNFGRILKVSASTGLVSLFAGAQGFDSDSDGIATSSTVKYPRALAIDSNADLIFCQDYKYRVRKVVAANQTIVTIAGSDLYGYSDGPATSALFSTCLGLWVDSTDNVFVLDGIRVRKIDVLQGVVSTVAGSGAWSVSSPENNVDATSAYLSYLSGLTGDSAGNLYFADNFCYRIFKLSLSTGILSYAVGTGQWGYSVGQVATSSPLGMVSALSLDSGTGELLIGDETHYRLRAVNIFNASSVMYDVVGRGSDFLSPNNEPLSSADIGSIDAIFKDSTGALFLTDNSNYRVRKVDTSRTTLTTAMGSGMVGASGNTGDGGPATSAMLFYPSAVIGDTLGTIFISDTSNNVIRTVQNGIIRLFAGTFSNALPALIGDGGAATSAFLFYPLGLWLTTDNALLVADSQNNRVRRIDSSGIISTVLGNGARALFGDGGSATDVSLNGPSAVLVGPDNSFYVADSQNHRVRMMSGVSNTMSTIAGMGEYAFEGGGFRGDYGPGTSALLYFPRDIALFSPTELLVADSDNHRLRLLSLTTNIVSTVVGTSDSSFADNVTATSTTLSYPFAICIANANVYIVDAQNYRIRKWTASTGIVSTIVGTGDWNFNGDGLTGTSTNIRYPKAVWVESTGAVVFSDDNYLRRLDSEGIVRVIAGDGSYGSSPDGTNVVSSRIGYVYHIAGDTAGNMYFTDSNKIRYITASNTLATFAGSGLWGYSTDHENVPATSASLNSPTGFWFDSLSNCFIADSGNNRIRKVAAGTALITTVAGNGVYYMLLGDGGPPLQASLSYPFNVAGDSAGNLYVADTYNHRVRKIDLVANIITTVLGSSVLFGISGPAREGTFATNSFLNNPSGLAMDTAGQVYLSDSYNNKVRLLFSAAYPTGQPTGLPSGQPTTQPLSPTSLPSGLPSALPSAQPSTLPTAVPSSEPTMPSAQPSAGHTNTPTSLPSGLPSARPSTEPSTLPTWTPSAQPTRQPSPLPSSEPTTAPSATPSAGPTTRPSTEPTSAPSSLPSTEPTSRPVGRPSARPTAQPVTVPCVPTVVPSAASTNPTVITVVPTAIPTAVLSASPTAALSKIPTRSPSASSTSRTSPIVTVTSYFTFVSLDVANELSEADQLVMRSSVLATLSPHVIGLSLVNVVYGAKARRRRLTRALTVSNAIVSCDVVLSLVDFPQFSTAYSAIDMTKILLSNAVESGSFLSTVLSTGSNMGSVAFVNGSGLSMGAVTFSVVVDDVVTSASKSSSSGSASLLNGIIAVAVVVPTVVVLSLCVFYYFLQSKAAKRAAVVPVAYHADA